LDLNHLPFLIIVSPTSNIYLRQFVFIIDGSVVLWLFILDYIKP
jgi:hypothetical protein